MLLQPPTIPGDWHGADVTNDYHPLVQLQSPYGLLPLHQNHLEHNMGIRIFHTDISKELLQKPEMEGSSLVEGGFCIWQRKRTRGSRLSEPLLLHACAPNSTEKARRNDSCGSQGEEGQMLLETPALTRTPEQSRDRKQIHTGCCW